MSTAVTKFVEALLVAEALAPPATAAGQPGPGPATPEQAAGALLDKAVRAFGGAGAVDAVTALELRLSNVLDGSRA